MNARGRLAPRLVVGLAIGLLALPSAAPAVVLETGGTRVVGFLINDDGKRLTVRVRTPDGQERVTTYAHADVRIVSRVDPQRLAALSRDDPKGYRTYADELAGKDGDPEARYVAMRLCLIAAYLDPKTLGPAALTKMSTLADTPAEARRCLAMAYLLDPAGDAARLRAPAVKPAAPSAVPPAALLEFAKALQQYRMGKLNPAAETAKRFGMAEPFRQAPGKLDQKTFQGWCANAICKSCNMKGQVRCPDCSGKGAIPGTFGARSACATCNGRGVAACAACEGTGVDALFPDDVLSAVLRAELWAVDQLTGGDSGRKAAGESTWSAALQDGRRRPVPPLSLETITEFDPRKCHYRNGTWVLPVPPSTR